MTCPTVTQSCAAHSRTVNRMVRIARRKEPTVAVQAAGELDAVTSAVLRHSLVAAVGRGTTVEINLSRVTFIDSAGAGLLLSADRLLRREGGRLILVDPSPRVHAALGQLAGCPAVRLGQRRGR